MKKYTFLFSFAILLIFQSACNTDSKEGKEEQLSERELIYKEVMEIHDAVMPKMSEINRLKRKLYGQIESDSTISDGVKSEVMATLTELANAENGMMNWMRDFKNPKESDPEQKVIDYLNQEKETISQVSDQMLNSLKKGSKLLDQLEAN
jgi:hypothetical protein